MPVTTPAASTLATAVFPLLQTPPAMVLARLMEAPAQTLLEPKSTPASGSAFTVTLNVAVAEPQLNVFEL